MTRELLTPIAAEGSSYPVNVSFRDDNGGDITPDSITWSLYTPDGTVVNSRSAVAVSSPAADVTVVLTGSDLTKLTTQRHEPRLLEVTAVCDSDAGNNLTYVQEFLFYIEDVVG